MPSIRKMRLNHSNHIFNIREATTFFERASGLLFRKKLLFNECLLISPCKSIHTIGMRYTIDVVYLDAFGLVIGTSFNVKPYRFAKAPTYTQSTVEFLSSSLIQEKVRIGCFLFLPINLKYELA